MTNIKFDPGRILGDKIVDMSRQELCEFGSKLCSCVINEVGTRAYRGGIFPENISQDEEGNLAIGPAAKNDWDGQELNFLAPELYWNSKKSQASDVYSIGLVLYYALNKAKLPYEGECDNPQLRRMNGEDFPAPRGAGRRLGEIIIKATHFKPEDRYKNVEEMQIMLDNCVKNLYLNGAPSAETLFNKDDDSLSDIERIMVGIIENGVEEPEEELPEEEEKLPEEAPAAQEAEAAEPEKLQEEEPEKTENPEEEKEEVKVYEPPKPKKVKRPGPKRPPVPILTEDKNPELEPVVIPSQNIKPAVQYGKSAEQEKKIAAAGKKKSNRSLIAVLIVCAVIVVTAIIVNALLNDLSWKEEEQFSDPRYDNLPVVDPENGSGVGVVDLPSSLIETPPPSTGIAVPSETVNPQLPAVTPAPEAPKEHRYEVFKEDISWTEASNKCIEKGGYLVVINDQAEFEKVISIAKAADLSRVWIGGHRINDVIVWESGEDVNFFPPPWGTGDEPSYVDSYDGTKEDYLMLWNNNGWQYNDNRNDPVADYPQFYEGTIGYICEYPN